MTARRAPLWLHAAVLALVLTALAVAIGTRSSFITDEAYVQIQLDELDRSGRWTLPHPLPAVDPEGDAFPLHGATEYDDGFTLYGKHPALVYLYRPVHDAFGTGGLVAVSVLGTVAAAMVAARLAERLRVGSGPLALWLVGAGSPLFFDAFVVHAHTVAAATAALAAYGALRAIEERAVAWGLLAVAAALCAALLRTEGVLYAAALGAAVVGVGLARRRVVVAVLGGAVGAAGAAAVLLDRWWSSQIAEGALVGSVPAARSGATYLGGRVSSLAYTMVMPGYRGITVPEALTAVGAVLVIVGIVAVHRRPSDPGAVALPIAGAAVLLVRSGMEWGPVPGLLLAFCVAVGGVLVVHRSRLAQPPVRLILVTVAIYAVGVAVTQYESGGHTEWGGRYFALAVPLLGVVAAVALQDAWSGWERSRARAVQGALVAVAVALAVLSVSTVRSSHDRNRERSDGVLAAAAALAPAGDGGLAVVVTEDDQVPRLARGRYGEVRFLLVRPAAMERYLTRLGELGIEELLIVSVDPARTLDRLGPYSPVGPVAPHDLQWTDDGGLVTVRLETP